VEISVIPVIMLAGMASKIRSSFFLDVLEEAGVFVEVRLGARLRPRSSSRAHFGGLGRKELLNVVWNVCLI
jgi:hypothetical protein